MYTWCIWRYHHEEEGIVICANMYVFYILSANMYVFYIHSPWPIGYKSFFLYVDNIIIILSKILNAADLYPRKLCFSFEGDIPL